MTSSAADPELSVVVPVYDEEGSLRALREELEPVVASCAATYELVFVDDGSRDGSPQILREFAEDSEHVRVFRLDRNHGLSSALHCGFNRARGRLIGTLDADLQNDPADLPKLLDAIAAGADMACGWRRDRDDPFVKRLSSKIANGYRNWRTGTSIQDVTCPLKVFKREVREIFHPFDGMHRFLPTLAAMRGYHVVEIPVNHRSRQHGSSKYGVWNRVFKGLRDLRTIRWMQQNAMTYRASPVNPASAGDGPA